MPLRRVPPVYAPVPARALGAAAWAARSRSGPPTESDLAPLRAHYPTRGIIITDSGTSALTLALRASLTLPERGERGRRWVALPAYCCPDVATAAVGAGFRIILYDVDPATLGPDPVSLRRALERGATHVVATHLFGRLVDVPAVRVLADTYGATVIEDAAQHAGGSWQGVRGGALASWSVLSFGRGKGLNAGGGGALLYDGGVPEPVPPPSLAPWWRSVRVVLTASAGELLAHPSAYWLPAAIPALHLGDTVYHPPRPVTGPAAANLALLAATLTSEPRVLAERQRIDAWYRHHLEDRPDVILAPQPPAAQSGALRFPVRLPIDFAKRLVRLGVARSYPRTLADYPALAGHIEGSHDPLPGAFSLATSLHTLPTHALMSDAERGALVQAIRTLSA